MGYLHDIRSYEWGCLRSESIGQATEVKLFLFVNFRFFSSYGIVFCVVVIFTVELLSVFFSLFYRRII
jgi:hypothetical protein